MRHRALLLSALCLLALAADTPPASPIRRDAAFWNMLTPAGRQVLSGVAVLIRDRCEGTVRGTIFTGGRYDAVENTIEVCGEEPDENPDRLRHEVLHALDWADGAGGDELSAKQVPLELYEQAEDAYRCGPNGGCHGWFRPPELFAMLPIVVGWDFEALPDDVGALYGEWFEEAIR